MSLNKPSLLCSSKCWVSSRVFSLSSSMFSEFCADWVGVGFYPSSETQGQLVGTTGFSWAKVYNKSGRAPGHLLLPIQFQKRLNSLLLIGQNNIFLANQRRGTAGRLSCLLTRGCFPHQSPTTIFNGTPGRKDGGRWTGGGGGGRKKGGKKKLRKVARIEIKGCGWREVCTPIPLPVRPLAPPPFS